MISLQIYLNIEIYPNRNKVYSLSYWHLISTLLFCFRQSNHANCNENKLYLSLLPDLASEMLLVLIVQ